MKVVSVEEAVAMIPDGASVMIGGFMARRDTGASARRVGATAQIQSVRHRQRHRDARARESASWSTRGWLPA